MKVQCGEVEKLGLKWPGFKIPSQPWTLAGGVSSKETP